MTKRIGKIRGLLLLSILLISLFAYYHKQVLYVYINYFNYKIAHEKIDVLASLGRTINSAKDSGFNCKNKDLPGAYAYQEIESRRKKSLLSYPYKITDCVQLPTGEIVLSINDGIARYYAVMELDKRNSKTYRVLDIKGEALG